MNKIIGSNKLPKEMEKPQFKSFSKKVLSIKKDD